MRFCGMCGMPLPQRPITAPGAQSTLNFTRVPVDPRALRDSGASWQRSEGASPQPVPDTAEPTSIRADVGSPVPPGGTSSSSARLEEAPRELVPNVSLDEYVKRFRYEPPKDPAEITMRGDAHVGGAERESAHQPAAPVSAAVENEVGASNTAASNPPPSPIATPPAADDVDSRLGLEPESSSEARIARPRFLDINQPAADTRSESAKEILPANSGTSTIAGPSFLGLNEPQSWAQSIGVEEGSYAPRNYHVRLWFALAILLLFAVLGYKEWRAQVYQSETGPVEVVRTKLNNWKQAALARLGPPDVNTDNGNSKPDIQVVPQAKPQPPQQQNSPPADTTANAGQAAPAQPPQNAEPAPTKEESTPSSAPAQNKSAPAAEQPKEAAAANTTQPAPAQPTPPPKPAPKRQSDAGVTREATNAAPGAEEMTKAKNASDSTAAAAWLWKATAKGNPDAPVQLANLYINGDGVPRSCEQAMVLLKTAAAK
jgi:hypothetical protein